MATVARNVLQSLADEDSEVHLYTVPTQLVVALRVPHGFTPELFATHADLRAAVLDAMSTAVDGCDGVLILGPLAVCLPPYDGATPPVDSFSPEASAGWLNIDETAVLDITGMFADSAGDAGGPDDAVFGA